MDNVVFLYQCVSCKSLVKVKDYNNDCKECNPCHDQSAEARKYCSCTLCIARLNKDFDWTSPSKP